MVGFNYRMTDIQAAVGREQLKRMPEIIATRRRMAARYAELLADIPGLGIPQEPEYARTNWQSYAVRLPAGRDQRAVMQFMLDHGIATRRGIMCAHRELPYQHEGGYELPESELAQDHSVVLPLFTQMSDEDQVYIADALREACRA
jgi:dTDP-4-amino-4,6-dideoxygalactose transaminase